MEYHIIEFKSSKVASIPLDVVPLFLNWFDKVGEILHTNNATREKIGCRKNSNRFYNIHKQYA